MVKDELIAHIVLSFFLGVFSKEAGPMTKKPFLRIVVAFCLLCLLGAAFLWGFVAANYKVFPFDQISAAYTAIFPKRSSDIAYLEKFDPASIITIHDEASLKMRRAALTKAVFGSDTLPVTTDQLAGEEVTSGPHVDRFGDVAKVYQVTLPLPLGLQSTYWRYLPAKEKDCLVIFHQGHRQDVFRDGGERTIHRFLTEGCRVIALLMPRHGENLDPPIINDPRLGPLTIEDHSRFEMLAGEGGVEPNPMRIFLEPILHALNYELSTKPFAKIAMVGISGGGWATTVYSAIDTRIQNSYPVAGTLPEYLRSPAASVGDWEQIYGPVIRSANTLEQYILASADGRRQLQILNKFDSCCFGGDWYKYYAETVTRISSDLGGSWSVASDDTHHEHQISEHAVDLIVTDFLGD